MVETTAEDSTPNAKGYGQQNIYTFTGQPSDWLMFSERFKVFLSFYDLENVLEDTHDDSKSVVKNKKVYQYLVSAIDNESLKAIMHSAKNNGNKAFQILSEKYIGKKADLSVQLLTHLFDEKLKCEGDHNSYINTIDLLKNQIDGTEVKLPDMVYTVLALKGLSSTADNRYEHFCSSVKVRQEFPKWDEFKNLIKIHESPLLSKDNSQDVVLAARAEKKPYKNSHQQGKPKNKQNIKCSFCNKVGHLTKNCWKRKAKQNKEKDSVNALNGDNQDFVFKCDYIYHPVNNNEYNQKYSDSLLVDSGATSHIVSDKKSFTDLDENYDGENHYIELADGTRYKGIVKGKGKAKFEIQTSKGVKQNIILENVLYIPSYSLNIFSMKKATNNGSIITFWQNGGNITTPDGTIFNIKCMEELYFLNIKWSTVNNIITSVTSDLPHVNNENQAECKKAVHNENESEPDIINHSDTDKISKLANSTHSVNTWHQIMGHCNINDVLKLETAAVGIKFSDKNATDCDTCTKGKMFQTMSKKADPRAKNPFEFIHTDLNGPMRTPSKQGYKYAITFVDDATGNIAVYFLKDKTETVSATKRFLADIAPWGKIKRMRCDNGTEYTSKAFRELLIDNQIRQEFSSPHSAHQNGTAERSRRTLFNMARCMMIDAKLSKSWWPHAIHTASYVRNRCFNPRINMTPYEAITGRKPDLSNMHFFGSTCFAYVQEKGKLDPRCEEAIFLGYDSHSPAFVVHLSKSQTTKRVRCVKFTDKFKSCEPKDNQPRILVPPYLPPSELPMVQEIPNEPRATKENIPPSELPMVQEIPNEPTATKEDKTPVETKKNPPRVRNKPKWLEDSVSTVKVDYFYRIANVPQSYREAITSDEKDSWNTAMQKEVQSLKDNNSFELVPTPVEKPVIGGCWIFAVKEGPNGEEYPKARYVAKGYNQILEENYLETFASTPRRTTIRMLAQKVAQEDMVFHQMDFDTAYLNADIDFEVYVKLPAGFVEKPNMVWKLKKALYGLKQSGRMWNSHLNNFLLKNGFVRSIADPCLYTYFEGKNSVSLIVWVDDLLIAASNIELMDKTKAILVQNFKMKDLGLASYFLGIQFKVNKNSVIMQQSKYVDKLLTKFSMEDCKIKLTPSPLGINTQLQKNSPKLDSSTLYRNIVGSLIYLMINTRPDICYIVTFLGQFMNNPTVAHLNLAKHVIKYLKGTKDLGLNFVKANSDLKLFGYCDSDWGGTFDRKSISGYCFMLQNNGPLISWKSCKQKIVALSTCEAEYVALTDAFKEARFLRQLFADFYNCNRPNVNLFVDNLGSIALAKNPVHHQRSKHIDIRYHFIRLDVEEGTVLLEYVPTEENYADMFTKPLSRVKLKVFSLIRGPMV